MAEFKLLKSIIYQEGSGCDPGKEMLSPVWKGWCPLYLRWRNVPDDWGNIYFLCWGQFYLCNHNRNLCLAYTKHSHFSSWLSGFTKIAWLHFWGGLHGIFESLVKKLATLRAFLNVLLFLIADFLYGSGSRSCCCLWSVSSLEVSFGVAWPIFVKCEVDHTAIS